MVLYAISAVYFAGVMVRLMLTLTPIVCILAAIAISRSLDNYMRPVFSQSNGNDWYRVYIQKLVKGHYIKKLLY